MITFEANPTGDAVEVFLDSEGIDRLIAILNRLKREQTDHDHLFSQSWGGWDLGEQPYGDGNIIHHVKIYALSEAALKSHG